MVVHFVRDEGVAGSNPVIPTMNKMNGRSSVCRFYILYQQEIDDMEAYVGTDEYVEEIAKEKLGLVNENEIILKAK